MVWFRRVVVQGLAALLVIALLGGAYIFSLNHTLGSPNAVESSLRNSTVYNQIAEYAIKRATESTSTPTGSVSLNNPQVQEIAKSVFSKQLVQQNAETFINSNYRWLDGETKTPAFTIDVSGARQSFATQVNKTVLDYLTKLPVCTPAQLQQLLSTAVDPLTIACRPDSVIPKAEADRVASQILTSDFLSQPIVTADNLKLDGQTEQTTPYYERFSEAPKAYQTMQKLPLLFVALAILAAIGVVFMSSSRRKGIRRIGLTFIFAGLLLIATKFASDSLFTKFLAKVFENTTDTTDVQKPLIDAAHQLEKQIVMTDLYFGIAFIVIGLIMAVLYFRMRSNKDSATPAASDKTAQVDSASEATPPATAQTNVPIPTPLAPISKPSKLHLARRPKGPTMDIARPAKKQRVVPAEPAPTNTSEPTQEPAEGAKKQRPRPRSRLIQ